MKPSTASYVRPYALILWGGAVSGSRPRTKLVFKREAVVINGETTKCKCHTWTKDRWSNTDNIVNPESIIRTWRSIPNIQAINNARKSLDRKAFLE